MSIVGFPGAYKTPSAIGKNYNLLNLSYCANRIEDKLFFTVYSKINDFRIKNIGFFAKNSGNNDFLQKRTWKTQKNLL